MSRFARPELVTVELPTLPEVEGGELAFEPVLPNPSVLLDLLITIPTFTIGGFFAINAVIAQVKAILALFRQRRMKAKLRARRPMPVLAFKPSEVALAAYNQSLAGLFALPAGGGAGAGDDTTAAITSAELPEILPADQEPTGEAPTTYNASIGQADKPCE